MIYHRLEWLQATKTSASQCKERGMRSCKFLENHAHVIAQSFLTLPRSQKRAIYMHATGTTNRRGRGNAAPGWRSGLQKRDSKQHLASGKIESSTTAKSSSIMLCSCNEFASDHKNSNLDIEHVHNTVLTEHFKRISNMRSS